jgi:hypothetical protein
MKRALRVAGAVLAVALAAGGAWAWNAATSAPAVALLPLPESLIAADTPAGRQLLAESTLKADHAALAGAFEPQSRPAYCGVASSVIVLNALAAGAPRLTQATFFTDAARAVRSPLRVTFGGMTLEQLGALLRSHGVEVAVRQASDSSPAAFRALAQQNLGDPGDFLVVNYQRSELGQKPTGHISPVAAYHAQADRLLVLDVAAYQYPAVWVPTEALFRAMSAVDPASGQARGFVVVRR